MIKDFGDNLTEDIFNGINSRYSRKIPNQILKVTRRKLDQINGAERIDTLKIPPNNKLKRLEGDLKEFWSIRINKQYRVIFKWNGKYATAVTVVDYHK